MRLAIATLASLLAIMPAAADQAFPAKLAGHAVLPALSFFDPPADAPADLAISGKFTAPDRKRLDTVGAVDGHVVYLGQGRAPRDRDQAAVQGPAAARLFRSQVGRRRHLLGAAGQWLRQQAEFRRCDAGPPPHQAGLGEREGRDSADDLPARPGQENPVPDHARRHLPSAILPAPISTSRASSRSATRSGSETSSVPT